jgi:uncharacterized membrane protein
MSDDQLLSCCHALKCMAYGGAGTLFALSGRDRAYVKLILAIHQRISQTSIPPCLRHARPRSRVVVKNPSWHRAVIGVATLVVPVLALFGGRMVIAMLVRTLFSMLVRAVLCLKAEWTHADHRQSANGK